MFSSESIHVKFVAPSTGTAGSFRNSGLNEKLSQRPSQNFVGPLDGEEE